MNLDDVLHASVDQIARSVEAPVADPLAIRRRARQEQQRRVLVGGSAAAAVLTALGVGVWQFASPDPGLAPGSPTPSVSSTSTTTAPTGATLGAAAAGAVWYSSGVLHDGATAIPLSSEVATNLAVAASGVLYGDGSGDVIYQPTNGSSTVVGRSAPLGPVGDPTSDVAVWFEETTPQHTDLVVYDVAKAAEVARVDIGTLHLATPDSMVGLQQPPVLWVGAGLPGDSAVYFKASGSVWKYDWTGGQQRIDRLVDPDAAGVIDVAHDLWAVVGPGKSEITFRRPDGRELSRYSPLEPDGTLSPDGKYYVGYSHGRSVIVDTATGTARPLELGDVQLVMGMTWARRTTVVMRAPDFGSGGRQESIVACDASSLQCEPVSPMAPLEADVLPAF